MNNEQLKINNDTYERDAGPEWPGRPNYRMSRRAPEEFARKAEEAKHRSNEAQRSAFVLRRRTKQILSEAGPRRVLLQLFSRREKFFFWKKSTTEHTKNTEKFVFFQKTLSL